MPIVPNWSRPLEEALQKQIRSTGTSPEGLARIRQTVSLLEGAPLSQDLADQLRRAEEALEKRYQEAVERIQRASTSHVLESELAELESLKGYRDADRIIEEGRRRAETLKAEEKAREAAEARRKRILMLVAAAAVLVVIAGLAINHGIRRRRSLEQIAAAQALADDGQTEQAVQALLALADAGKSGETFEPVYALSESVLENTAREDGYAAAFELYDQLRAHETQVVKRDDFPDHARQQLLDGALQGAEQWALYSILRERAGGEAVEGVDAAAAQAMLNGCIEALCDDMASGSDRDVATWVESNREGLDGARMAPGIALRFLYALNDAGCDAAALFPEGVLVDIPLAGSIVALTNDLAEGRDATTLPDMKAMLPISITESRNAEEEGIRTSRRLFEVTSSDTGKLDEQIAAMQSSDDHYDVRLLPEYLLRMPEDMRAAAYDDCTALLALQKTYVEGGTLTTVTEHVTNSSTGRRLSSFSSSSYKHYFSALDLVAVYGIADANAGVAIYTNLNKATIAEEGWFEAHKNDHDLESEAHMLGVFGSEELKEQYDAVVDNLLLYRLILQAGIGSGDDGEEDAYEAD